MSTSCGAVGAANGSVALLLQNHKSLQISINTSQISTNMFAGRRVTTHKQSRQFCKTPQNRVQSIQCLYVLDLGDNFKISEKHTAKPVVLVPETLALVFAERGLKNHFFHTHYLTTNQPLNVIVLLCYSCSCMHVSIQLLAAIQINQLIDRLTHLF